MPVNSQTKTKLDKKSLVTSANGTSSLANVRSIVEALELESLTLTGDLVVTGSITAGSIVGATDFPVGSVSAPSIAFTGSLTTGLYRSAADAIGVAVAGALDFSFAANTFTALSGSTIATNTIAETTAASGVTVDGLLIKDGGATANSMYAGFYPTGATNNITAGTGGAIGLTYFTTINTDAGGDAFTLANGTQIGQLKLIRLVVDGGGDAVITPTSLSGGTTITMNDASDEVELLWNGTAWVVIKNLGATVA